MKIFRMNFSRIAIYTSKIIISRISHPFHMTKKTSHIQSGKWQPNDSDITVLLPNVSHSARFFFLLVQISRVSSVNRCSRTEGNINLARRFVSSCPPSNHRSSSGGSSGDRQKAFRPKLKVNVEWQNDIVVWTVTDIYPGSFFGYPLHRGFSSSPGCEWKDSSGFLHTPRTRSQLLPVERKKQTSRDGDKTALCMWPSYRNSLAPRKRARATVPLLFSTWGRGTPRSHVRHTKCTSAGQVNEIRCEESHQWQLIWIGKTEGWGGVEKI